MAWRNIKTSNQFVPSFLWCLHGPNPTGRHRQRDPVDVVRRGHSPGVLNMVVKGRSRWRAGGAQNTQHVVSLCFYLWLLNLAHNILCFKVHFTKGLHYDNLTLICICEAKGSLDIWVNTLPGVSMRVFLHERGIWIGRLGEADPLLRHEGLDSTDRRGRVGLLLATQLS